MFYLYKKKKVNGFTLVELLVVVAIITSVSFFSFPFYSNSFNNSYSQSDLKFIESQLKQTRQKSYAAVNNSSFGVFLDKEAREFVFYQGSAYSQREVLYDFKLKLDESLKIVLPTENFDINFLSGTGMPDMEKLIVFEVGDSSQRKIFINKFGSIILE